MYNHRKSLKHKIPGMIILAVIVVILSPGCSGGIASQSPTEGSGSLRLSVQWPGTNNERFIPDNAETIYIEIEGSGIPSTAPLATSIIMPDTTVTVEDLPAGTKIATIRVLDSETNILTQKKESFISKTAKLSIRAASIRV